jgi:uncharacterized membrane protein YkoI
MRAMRIGLGVSLVAALAVGTVVARGADEKDKKVDTSTVPAKVMDAVKARFPGADVTSVEKEIEEGKVVYDFELKQGDMKYEADVKEDGTIAEIEKQVKDVPEKVTKAIKDKWPKATVKEVMEVDKVSGTTETPDHYEVTLTTDGGKEKEVDVSMEGKVTEEAGDEKGGDKEKDEKK